MPNPSCIFAYGIDGNVPLSKMQQIQLFDSSTLQCINVSSLHKLLTSQYTINLFQFQLFLYCVICSLTILPILLLNRLTITSQLSLKGLLSSASSVIKSSPHCIKAKQHLTFPIT